MAANIRIDQSTGAGAGTSGQARSGLWLSQAISLVDTGTGFSGTRQWTLLDKPSGSAASLSGATSTPASFTPDVAGTYLVRLRWNASSANDDNKTLVMRVTKNSGGVDVPLFFPRPAYLEEDAHSEGIAGQGTTGRGYAPLQDAVVAQVQTNTADIDAAESDIAAAEGAITAIEGDITAIEGDITTIEGNITTLQAAVNFTSVSFEFPLILSGLKRMTVSGADLSADGALVLALATAGAHAIGGTTRITIPAGTLSGSLVGEDAMRVASNINPNAAHWDPIDVASDQYVEIRCTSTSPLRAIAIRVDQGLTDASSPTISTAIIDGDTPDKLELVFNEPVAFPSLTGLTVEVDAVGVGITAVTSGNGTASAILDLASSVSDPGSVVNFIVGGGRTLQSMNGPLIATGTTLVTLENFIYTMPGEIFDYSGQSTTYNGSFEVTAVANATPGGTNWGTLTITGTISRITTNGKHGWRLGSGEHFHVDAGAQVTMTSGSILVVCQTNSTAATYETIAALGLHGGLTSTEVALFQHGSTNSLNGRRDAAGTGEVSTPAFNGIGTALHAALFVWDAAGGTIYIDDVSKGTSAVAATTDPCRRLAIGCFTDLSSLGSQGQLDIYCVKASTTKLAGAQITEAFDWAQLTYATP